MGLLVLVVMEQLYPSAALRPVHILVAQQMVLTQAVEAEVVKMALKAKAPNGVVAQAAAHHLPADQEVGPEVLFLLLVGVEAVLE